MFYPLFYRAMVVLVFMLLNTVLHFSPLCVGVHIFIPQFPVWLPHVNLLREMLLRCGTQLHEERGEGFSHSAPPVIELMLLDVLSQRLKRAILRMNIADIGDKMNMSSQCPDRCCSWQQSSLQRVPQRVACHALGWVDVLRREHMLLVLKLSFSSLHLVIITS